MRKERSKGDRTANRLGGEDMTALARVLKEEIEARFRSRVGRDRATARA